MYRQRAKPASLEERIAEMKARNEAKTVKIPSYYASNDVRRARLRKLRQYMGLTIKEMAVEMGLSPKYYERVEAGQPNAQTTMAHLQLAEKIYRGYREVQRRRKIKIENERIASLGAVPEVETPPDNPELKAKAVSMYVLGKSVDTIARELAMRPEVISLWVASVR